jgi:hypothetical protein
LHKPEAGDFKKSDRSGGGDGLFKEPTVKFKRFGLIKIL